MERFYSSVSPKGQITLPVEIRRALKIMPKDRVAIEIEQGKVTVKPAESKLLAYYQKAGRLKKGREWKEVTRTAWEEHARQVAEEGLGG